MGAFGPWGLSTFMGFLWKQKKTNQSPKRYENGGFRTYVGALCVCLLCVCFIVCVYVCLLMLMLACKELKDTCTCPCAWHLQRLTLPQGTANSQCQSMLLELLEWGRWCLQHLANQILTNLLVSFTYSLLLLDAISTRSICLPSDLIVRYADMNLGSRLLLQHSCGCSWFFGELVDGKGNFHPSPWGVNNLPYPKNSVVEWCARNCSRCGWFSKALNLLLFFLLLLFLAPSPPLAPQCPPPLAPHSAAPPLPLLWGQWSSCIHPLTWPQMNQTLPASAHESAGGSYLLSSATFCPTSCIGSSVAWGCEALICSAFWSCQGKLASAMHPAMAISLGLSSLQRSDCGLAFWPC